MRTAGLGEAGRFAVYALKIPGSTGLQTGCRAGLLPRTSVRGSILMAFRWRNARTLYNGSGSYRCHASRRVGGCGYRFCAFGSLSALMSAITFASASSKFLSCVFCRKAM